MTGPDWPQIAARLHHTLAACRQDTDVELSAGPRRLRLAVRRDSVSGRCPGYDPPRLAELGWRPADDGDDWWHETPRTAEALRWWGDFASDTARAVLTGDAAGLACRVVAPPDGGSPAPRTLPGGDTVPIGNPAPAGIDSSDVVPGRHRVAAPPVSAPAAGPGVGDLLARAAADHDLPGYLGAFAAGTVCVPLAGEPSPQREFPWTVVLDADRAPLLPVFTTAEALTAFAGVGVPFLAVPAAELLAAWPDPAWGLAVDPGAPHGLTLSAPALAALLAANDLDTGEEAGTGGGDGPPAATTA
ncbi:SseB family protein [Micromonospora sp. KC606]|uniref:SseB family protein n=1 Tax=Micromonospora sp. KC606 TaxID=2530379 RepID=UPI00104FE141|nr:SseB family protein [Micromonospora sp. KC606]TDC83439.1 SseB family protein [Micromonospora sp. KC606]